MELGPGIVGGEGPGDRPPLGVALRFECCEMPFQGCPVSRSPTEAFSADNRDLDLSEPKLLHLL
jgi:hypothetical protein